MGDFNQAMANRSLRTIKSELEFLADSAIITLQQFESIMANLPANSSSVRSPATNGVASPMSHLSLNNQPNHTPVAQPHQPASPTPAPAPTNNYPNEKQGFPEPAEQEAPPPAYPSAPPAPTALCTATALYAYQPTDAGDLALQANDKISVTEYMNAEWWKGRSERTGEEGIFPRTYVRVEEEKMPLTSPKKGSSHASYGNMPMAVSEGGSGSGSAGQGKTNEYGKKFGKKMGNAAIFGAGATIGGNIVNSIF